jgi:hypothetical protein
MSENLHKLGSREPFAESRHPMNGHRQTEPTGPFEPCVEPG